MRVAISACVGLIVAAQTGCVVVNPKGDVNMSPLPQSWSFGKKHSTANKTVYGSAMEDVIGQQEKVVHHLQKREWEPLVKANAEWTEQVRVLSGYADSTRDPARFRAYCDQLLAQNQSIREAALRQDAVACNTAIHSCDPVLNGMTRDFPIAAAPVVYASPASPNVAAPQPYGSRTSVNVNVP